jgi:hypothetical protein
MAAVEVLTPSGDQSGVTDTAAINGAFSDADRNVVVSLDPGDWFVNAPLSPSSGNELSGSGGGVNGATSRAPSGTVIHPTAGFGGTAVIDLASGCTGNRIMNLAILNDLSALPGVDGIACHGNINGLRIEGVSIANVTGHGIAFFQGGDGTDGDGLKMRTVMIQRPGLNGVHRPMNDANIHDVHIQYAGDAGDPANRHGFFSTAGSTGNATYIGCRADLCAGSGWVIDHKGTYGDATKLVGCSTERNGESGCLIINSSGSGTDWRAPVILSGCCFEGDGQNGGLGGNFGGIEIRGRNRVFMAGVITAVSKTDISAGAPKYALILRRAGSAGGRPETVEWASGRMNYSTGQGGDEILNRGTVDLLAVGPTVTVAGGFQASGTLFT